MVGEDAVSVYTQLLMKFIDLIAKIGEEHRRNKQLKGPKKPKIRQGSLSKADFKRIMKKGAEFSFIQIPKDKEAEIENTIKSLNGSFFKASDPESNNSLFAVPVSQVDLVNTAVKQCLSKVLRDEPETVSVKDGMERIAPEDMPLVSEIMQGYDIPIFSFKGSDGKYTNIVPTEYEGQYERAMNRVKELKELGKDIEVFTFEQTGRLDKPDFFTKTISHNDETDIYATVRDKGWIIQLSCFIISFLISICLWIVSRNINNSSEYFVFICVMLIALNILLYILLNKIGEDNKIMEEYKLTEQRLLAERQMAVEIKDRYIETKGLKHDINHCLIVISEMLAAKKYDETRKYVTGLVDSKIYGYIYPMTTGKSAIQLCI